jgi:hypothetical protein
MIFFSTQYRQDQSIIENNYLNCYFDFKDLIKRISRMVEELLIHNELIDRIEAIRILQRDNSGPLKCFNYGDLKRYISTK